MFSEELFERLRRHAESFPRREQAILLCLHEIQDHYGYIPEESLEPLSELLGLPLNHVKQVVSFYDMFDTDSPARYRIRVCVGIVCHLLGCERLVSAVRDVLGVGLGERTPDGRFKVVPVQCIGACAVAPVFMVNEDTYRFEGKEKLHEILSGYT